MKNNNSEALKTICAQAEIILSEFGEEFNKRDFIISSISIFRIAFVNYSSEKTITFHFENEYNYNFGFQPLQDISLRTSRGEDKLSILVDEKEHKGAFRKHFMNRAPGQDRLSIFKILVLKYFLDVPPLSVG